DGLEDGAGSAQRQPGAAVLLWNECREIAGLRQSAHELRRICGLVVEPHPVLVGKVLADAADALAQLLPFRIDGDCNCAFCRVGHRLVSPRGWSAPLALPSTGGAAHRAVGAKRGWGGAANRNVRGQAPPPPTPPRKEEGRSICCKWLRNDAGQVTESRCGSA